MLQEEKCRLQETKKVRKEELKELEDYFNYNLISQDEYEKRKQLVLSKK